MDRAGPSDHRFRLHAEVADSRNGYSSFSGSDDEREVGS
jgi:hypothetical protein